jgi:hypothetical protein
MFKQVIRLRQYLAILSLIVLCLLLAIPASANTATFTGTIDSSDNNDGSCNNAYFDVYGFNVTPCSPRIVGINPPNTPVIQPRTESG